MLSLRTVYICIAITCIIKYNVYADDLIAQGLIKNCITKLILKKKN